MALKSGLHFSPTASFSEECLEPQQAVPTLIGVQAPAIGVNAHLTTYRRAASLAAVTTPEQAGKSVRDCRTYLQSWRR